LDVRVWITISSAAKHTRPSDYIACYFVSECFDLHAIMDDIMTSMAKPPHSSKAAPVYYLGPRSATPCTAYSTHVVKASDLKAVTPAIL